MAADPSEYTVIRNLQTALQAITIAGGYHYDVQAVAVKLDPQHGVEALVDPDGPRPIIVIEAGVEDSWSYQPGTRSRLELPATIHWVGESAATDDTSKLLAFYRGCADIEKAIAVDISRGGRAIDTRIVKRLMDRSIQGAQVWAMVDVTMPLIRVFGQPNG